MDEDSEQEFDYGEEPEEYDEYEDDNIVDFSYRQLEQVGVGVESGESIYLRTEMEGSSDLAKLQARRQLLNMPPEEKFKLDVIDFLSKSMVVLGLRDSDKRTILSNIPKLPLVKYKNPAAYVLGYAAKKKGIDKTGTLPASIKDTYSSQANAAMILKYHYLWQKLIG